MPLDVWKASPNTTNGNEQSHRNVNRDGVKLVPIAGALLSKAYDQRSLTSIKVFEEDGINTCNQVSTHFHSGCRSLVRGGEGINLNFRLSHFDAGDSCC